MVFFFFIFLFVGYIFGLPPPPPPGYVAVIFVIDPRMCGVLGELLIFCSVGETHSEGLWMSHSKNKVKPILKYAWSFKSHGGDILYYCIQITLYHQNQCILTRNNATINARDDKYTHQRELLPQNTKIIPRIHDRRIRIHGIHLILLLPPLRMIDPINPLLRFDHDTCIFRFISAFHLHQKIEGEKKGEKHTPILLHKSPSSTRSMLLAPLNRNSPISIITSINLQVLLIRKNIHPNPRLLRTQRQNAHIACFRSQTSWPIDDKCIIVPGAIIPAPVRCAEDVPPDLLRGGEIEGGVLGDGRDGAGGDFDVVDCDVAL